MFVKFGVSLLGRSLRGILRSASLSQFTLGVFDGVVYLGETLLSGIALGNKLNLRRLLTGATAKDVLGQHVAVKGNQSL